MIALTPVSQDLAFRKVQTFVTPVRNGDKETCAARHRACHVQLEPFPAKSLHFVIW